MEVQSREEPHGAKIELKKDHDKVVFGRGFGFNTDDRTVSRRHVAFELKSGAKQTEPTIIVSFEVLGKNPVWVVRSEDDEEKIRVFRRSEKGELAAGDRFCVSGKKPAWFGLREIGAEEDEKRVSGEGEIELAEGSGSGSEFVGFDVSGIDPVREFGFLVIGHEFDHYPKHMIRDVKRWDWFIEGDGKESEDEDEGDFGKKRKRGVRKMTRKRKKGKDNQNDDEDWTGESEDDIELVSKANHRPKYSTRSKDRDKLRKNNNSQGSKKSSQKKLYIADDDEDETLGGFIVGDEDVDQDVDETNGDDEEEEDFVDVDEEEDA